MPPRAQLPTGQNWKFRGSVCPWGRGAPKVGTNQATSEVSGGTGFCRGHPHRQGCGRTKAGQGARSRAGLAVSFPCYRGSHLPKQPRHSEATSCSSPTGCRCVRLADLFPSGKWAEPCHLAGTQRLVGLGGGPQGLACLFSCFL